MIVTRYNKQTGVITGILCTPSPWDRVSTEENWIGGNSNDRYQYVSNGLIVARPVMPGTLDKTTIFADGQDVATISNLPPCTLTVNGTAYEVTDGSLQVTSNIPKTFRIEVEAFPCLPASFTVEAIECA